MTLVMKKPVSTGETSDIFFNASSAASLDTYRKIGKIPVAISALVKNGKSYDLIPIGSGLPPVDSAAAQPAIDYAVKPLVKYVNENSGSYPLAFFLSVTAEGMTRDLENGETEQVDVIINAARTQDKKGKTNVFKITKDGYAKLTTPEGDAWVEVPNGNDLPSSVAQTILDMVWKSYIVSRNMSLLNNNTKA